MVRISFVPLGLLDGIRHSVSRDNLFNCLPTTSSKHSTPKHSHRVRTGESRRRVAVNVGLTPKQQHTASINPLRPLENGAVSSWKTRRELLPVMNRQGSKGSLASSVSMGGDSFTSDNSFHSKKTFPVCTNPHH